MDRRHWDDIGYNFVIGEDGAVYVGRGWDQVGTHSVNYNDKSIAIALIGNFEGEFWRNLRHFVFKDEMILYPCPSCLII